jgi:ferredoxin
VECGSILNAPIFQYSIAPVPPNRSCHRLFAPSYFESDKGKIMADVANRYPENTGGKYFVDNQCIDCDLCRETAPDNFKRNDDGGYSFVFKQPENPDEEARCKEAKEGCPVEAIGDNG